MTLTLNSLFRNLHVKILTAGNPVYHEWYFLSFQAFVKDYLITFVRLLLGIDQAVGSGHLSCVSKFSFY